MGKKSSIRTTISKRRGGVFKTTFAVLSLLVATFVLLLAFRREERSAVSSLSSSEEEKEEDQFLQREAFEEEKEISSDIEYHTYSIVNSYPHDTNAFTQGFLYHSASESFFESTGSVPHGKLSDVRRADIETGEVLELKTIPESAFGEGLVFMREETKRAKKNSLVQLVWKSSRAFTHEIKDIGGKVEEKNNALLFQEESGEQKMFNTDLRDGWGVTSSKREGVIVISNGTAHLTLFDMNKGESIGFITVHDNGVEQRFPNELEAVRGEIWANILEKECVARIDERTGKVLGWIDFTGLKKLQDNVGSVMNGIAYDERRDRIFVTGKQWRRVFEVKISKGSRKKGAIELGRKRCHSPTSLPNYGYP